MKPLIGMFPAIDSDGGLALNRPYSKAIERAGGVPLVIPYLSDKEDIYKYIDLCDGFCFTGGVDINPRYYGEETTSGCGEICAMRDEMEMACARPVINSGKPVIAICRGMQLINTALGGTLYQDIPTELGESFPHVQKEEKTEYSHSVNVIENTPLHRIVGRGRIRANSFHHQALKRLGDGLRTMAVADDGVIEAVYSELHGYLMAYQWHPERLCDYDTDSALIFESFISAASENMKKQEKRINQNEH